jgi:hypothetical protein
VSKILANRALRSLSAVIDATTETGRYRGDVCRNGSYPVTLVRSFVFGVAVGSELEDCG